jgi:hypothetical protein
VLHPFLQLPLPVVVLVNGGIKGVVRLAKVVLAEGGHYLIKTTQR